MTISQMHSEFKLLIDKFNSPYFTDTEVDIFLNKAMKNWINENVFTRRTEAEGIVVKSASEFTQNWEFLVYPLISSFSITSATNYLRFSDIEANLSGNKILAILDVVDSNEYEISWVRHNNFGTMNRNSFTRPSTAYRKYRIDSTGLEMRPTTNSEIFKVTVLRTPVVMSLGGNVSCELPVAAHEKIVAMAVDLAKFPIEDPSVGGISNVTV